MDHEMYITEITAEKLKGLTEAMLTTQGREVFNPEPKVLHTGIGRPLTLAEQIKRVLRQEVSAQAEAQGFESFEEADNFDVQDGFEDDPQSKYQLMENEYPAPKNVERPETIKKPAEEPATPTKEVIADEPTVTESSLQ